MFFDYVSKVESYPLLKVNKKKSVSSLINTFKIAAMAFGKVSASKKYEIFGIPKEQQLSINFDHLYVLNSIDCTFKVFDVDRGSPNFIYQEVVNVVTNSRLLNYYGLNIKIKHFTDEERNLNKKIIKRDSKGVLRIYSQDGEIYDTSDCIGKGFEQCVAYAISLQGELITCQHRIYKISDEDSEKECNEYSLFHSTLLSCMPGICFGMIKIKEGRICYMNNHSGHYMPAFAHLFNAVKLLYEVLEPDCIVECFAIDSNMCLQGYKYNYDEFLEKAEPNKKKYFSAIKQRNDEYRKLILEKKLTHNKKNLTLLEIKNPVLTQVVAQNNIVRQ